MNKLLSYTVKISFLLLAFVLAVGWKPVMAQAPDTRIEISGWIPYWAAKDGIASAKQNLGKLSYIHPFAFSVKEDGGLKDLANLGKSNWKKFFKSAKSKSAQVIPTIMWSDSDNMHKVLTDEKLRAKHVKEIAAMVKKGKYDGIDIDYENKYARTRDGFSAFLKELKAEIGNKILVCTIEARTPLDSLYRVPKDPATHEYANDFEVIGRYCDRVQIMTYDQQRADLKLNDAKAGLPYSPVADIDWVRKVAILATQSIPKQKIMLGVATYGREYEVTAGPNSFIEYKRLRAINPDIATELAKKHNVKPGRNQGGETSFTYVEENSPYVLLPYFPVPIGTPEHDLIATRALAYAKNIQQPIKFRLVWWSDAESIKQKVDLARELGLRGIAIFKIDGGEDPAIWDMI